MQEQVLQAAKLAALATLTAGVAHELNSPLTAVLGYANVLQEQSDDPMVHQAAERITRCGGRMRDIIEQLTVFTRSGDTPRIQPLHINDSIRSASVLLEAALRKRDPSVELCLTLGAGLPPVTCDPGHLQSVIHHLVLNAHAACASALTAQAAQTAQTAQTAQAAQTAEETAQTAEETAQTAEIAEPAPQRAGTTPPVIELSTEVTADGVRIQCRDPGCGMTPEVRRRAFDPFFTTQDVGEGTGLGLFVCHRLVTDHGGTIRLDSTAGEGTTVTIDFPAADISHPGPPAP
jgi:signal transduction histidine kinase